MVEHDELASRLGNQADVMRRAVEGLRASRNPSVGAEDRVFAALELQLGGPPGGFDPSGGGGGGGGGGGMSGGSGAAGSGATGTATAPVTIGWAAKVIGATAGMTAAGLLALRVGVGAVQVIAGDAESVRDEVAETVEVEPRDTHTTYADDDDSPVLIEADTAAIPVQPGGSTRPIAKPAEVPPVDALAAELALFGVAKRASTPSAALELLEQHAREYPNGTMASEREALTVVALCQLDRTDEARTRARILVSQRPGLPLLHRMRSECPALSDLLRQIAP